jgi:hypothetical protein
VGVLFLSAFAEPSTHTISYFTYCTYPAQTAAIHNINLPGAPLPGKQRIQQLGLHDGRQRPRSPALAALPLDLVQHDRCTDGLKRRGNTASEREKRCKP